MFELFGLIGFFAFISLLMPWFQMGKLWRLEDDLANIKEKLLKIERAQKTTPAPAASLFKSLPMTNLNDDLITESPSAPFIPEKPSSDQNGIDPANLWGQNPTRVNIGPLEQTGDTLNERNNGFEFNLAAKLPVWIGSLSLICAGFFLVKYSIDAGWLGPLTRVILGGVMGLSFLIGGQWLSRKNHIDNHARISQGVIGAGLVTLYFSIYAAVNLYHLIPDLMGFILMAIVTFNAIILSIRHGQAIAVFGLLGGLLTPALISSSEPNAAALFTYLFILFAGMMFVLARHGWWMMATATLIGIYVWTALFIGTAFHTSDLSILTLFITATCAVAFLATQYATTDLNDESEADIRPYFNMEAIAAGLVTIFVLNLQVHLSLFDWSLLGLLSIGGVSLLSAKPYIYRIPILGQMVLMLVLFGLWCNNAPFMEMMIVAIGFTSIYGVLTHFLMRQVSDPRPLAVLQVAGLLGLYMITNYQINGANIGILNNPLSIMGLGLTGYFAYQTLQMRRTYLANQNTQDHLVVIYALGSTAALSLSMIFTLPHAYLPLAFVAQAAATMWIYSRIPMTALPKIILGLLITGFIFNGHHLLMFSKIIIQSIFGEGSSLTQEIALLSSDTIFIQFLMPTVFLILTAFIYRRNEVNIPTALHKWIYGGIIGHVLALLYIVIRQISLSMNVDSFSLMPQTGFIERGIITAVIAAFGIILIQANKKIDPLGSCISYGYFILGIAAARLCYFDLFLHNPYFHDDQYVGSWIILNGITLTYGFGSILFLMMISSAQMALNYGTLRRILKIAAVAMLFMFISMTVRQFFHGGVLSNVPTSHEEFYAYSITWLLTGIILLWVGLVTGNQGTRQASFAFMVLTVVKVFLFDAAELEGLYRIFSFLGLGISLMGLSFLYTKALKKQKDQDAEKFSRWGC